MPSPAIRCPNNPFWHNKSKVPPRPDSRWIDTLLFVLLLLVPRDLKYRFQDPAQEPGAFKNNNLHKRRLLDALCCMLCIGRIKCAVYAVSERVFPCGPAKSIAFCQNHDAGSLSAAQRDVRLHKFIADSQRIIHFQLCILQGIIRPFDGDARKCAFQRED